VKPILFPKNATTFTTNGLGRLDAISCMVTEERNGMYELEMEIAESANHASEIEISSIIVVKPSQGASYQPFRVYKITKPINGIFAIFAQHISYQLSYIPVMPFTIAASNHACNDTLQGLLANAVESCPYTFWTNVTTISSYKQTVPASIRSRLGGSEGSVLDMFKGEYEWDGFTVKLWTDRGVTIPTVSLRYGKNITDLKQEENIENTITGVVPYWTDSEGGELVTLPEKSVDSQYASAYPFKRTVPYDFSQSFETKPTVSELRTKAQAYVNSSGLGVPKVSIKLSFVNLADTEEFKDVAALQSVKLCDNITVVFEKLGISTTAKIVKTIYNVLTEKYDSIEIGSLRSTLVTTISGNMEDIEGVGAVTQDMIKKSTTAIQGDIDDALDNAKDYADGAASTAQSNAESYADGAASTAETNAKSYTDTQLSSYSTTTQVNTAINNATAWITGSNGYVMAVKDNNGTWKELIFADHNDPADWVNVLRINENGIGFSSDGGANYTQAWTLDGKLVIGGTNVPSLTVYDNSTPPNILLQINSQGMVWNASNSSLAQDGTLSTKYSVTNGQRMTYLSEGKISFDYVPTGGSGLANKPEIYQDAAGEGAISTQDGLSIKGKGINLRSDFLFLRPREENGSEDLVIAAMGSNQLGRKVVIYTVEDLYLRGSRSHGTGTALHEAVNGSIYIDGTQYMVINGRLCTY